MRQLCEVALTRLFTARYHSPALHATAACFRSVGVLQQLCQPWKLGGGGVPKSILFVFPQLHNLPRLYPDLLHPLMTLQEQ